MSGYLHSRERNIRDVLNHGDWNQLIDESQQRGRAVCRTCKEMKNDVLADNGYCGDCD